MKASLRVLFIATACFIFFYSQGLCATENSSTDTKGSAKTGTKSRPIFDLTKVSSKKKSSDSSTVKGKPWFDITDKSVKKEKETTASGKPWFDITDKSVKKEKRATASGKPWFNITDKSDKNKKKVRSSASEQKHMKKTEPSVDIRPDVSEGTVTTATTISPTSPKRILSENIRYMEIAPSNGTELLREKRIGLNIDTDVTYDDNIFLTIDDTKHDVITTISPGIYAYTGNSQHQFSAFYNADVAIYGRHADQNRINQAVGARANLFRTSALKFNVSDTVRPTSDPATSEQTKYIRRVYNDLQASARYDISPKASVELAYDMLVQNYLPSAFQEFSYIQQTVSPAVYWKLSPKTSLSLQYDLGITSYYDGAGYNSIFNQVLGGVEGRLTSKSTVYLKAGFQYRTYSGDSLKDPYWFTMQGIYDYSLSPKTKIQLMASSNIEESVYENVAYYKSLNFFATCTHSITNNLAVSATGFYIYNDYPRSTPVNVTGNWDKRVDNLFGASGKLDYKFRSWLRAYAQYEYKVRDSNFRDFRYADNRISGGFNIGF